MPRRLHVLASSKRKSPQSRAFVHLAEKAGFEPAVGYEPTHAFQACDLNHSSISPCKSVIIRPCVFNGCLLSLCHTAYNVAKASVHIGDFASDATSKIRHQERGGIAYIINRHIATQRGIGFNEIQNPAKTFDA